MGLERGQGVAPLLLITIAVAGLVFGREAAQGRILGQLEGLMGPAGAIETSVANSQDSGAAPSRRSSVFMTGSPPGVGNCGTLDDGGSDDANEGP